MKNTEVDSNLFIIGLLFLLFLGIVLWKKLRSSSGNNVLLIGTSNSGKTALFTHLVYGEFKPSYMSMKENIGSYATKKRTVQIVDIPGHDRVRQSIIDRYKNKACAIIFLVDSKTVQLDIRDVAEVLYSVLIDSVIYSNCKNVLVVCNKQDQPESKGPAVVKLLLEKEINLLRGLKSKLLESTENESAQTGVFLGSNNSDFEFSQIKSTHFSFLESSLIVEDGVETNIESITEWLRKR